MIEPAPVTAAAPNEMRDPLVRAELKRASVWFGLAIGFGLLVLLIQPLMLIFAGLVFAAMLDGGARLLGRVLPVPRGLRVDRGSQRDSTQQDSHFFDAPHPHGFAPLLPVDQPSLSIGACSTHHKISV